MRALNHQEKSLYAELLGDIACIGVFLTFRSVKATLIAFAIVYFAVGFVLNRKSRFKSGDYLIDERDWQIESRGIRASYKVLLAGFVFLFALCWNGAKLPPTRILNIVLLTLFASSAVRVLQMLRLYRLPQ